MLTFWWVRAGDNEQHIAIVALTTIKILINWKKKRKKKRKPSLPNKGLKFYKIKKSRNKYILVRFF